MPKESVKYLSLPILGGVELMHANFVRHTFSKHYHEEYAVGCIEQGAMGFRYRGENLVAAAGEINLVVPGEAHDGHAAMQDGWLYRMFYLRPETLQKVYRAMGKGEAQPYFRKGVLIDAHLARQLRGTHARILNPFVPTLEKESLLFALLARWIYRHADESGRFAPPGIEHGAVRKAKDYLQEHFADDVTLDELALHAGLSPFHLLRVFEKEVGLTPHVFLTQTRMERGRGLLAGSLRLADVAQAVGCADQSHFTRLFKRQYGLTPGNYRKILQNHA